MPTPDVQERFGLAVNLHQAQRFVEAEAGYREVLAADPSFVPAIQMLGVLAHQTGRDPEAIELFGRMIALDPGNADAHNLLAYSYRKQATPDLAKAFEHYNVALKINPNHKGANEYIGEAYLMDKKPAKAEEHLARLKTICGNTTCEEYADLAKSIAAYKAKNK